MTIGTRMPPVARNMGLAEFVKWLAENGFGAIDSPPLTEEVNAEIHAAGLSIGTCDLDMGAVKKSLSQDDAARAEGVSRIKEQIEQTAALGGELLFLVFLPDDPKLGRAKNFDIWKETWPELVGSAEKAGLRFATEWWPGPGPHYPALGCTPEMWRAMLEVCDSPALGMCYDPSHLARIQIDWMRALHEISDRIVHVHAKDTQLIEETLYATGILGPTFGTELICSEGWWRYCIPGDGMIDWGEVVNDLDLAGFDGVFSIELEDHRYWANDEQQLKGLLAAKSHLEEFIF